MFKYINFSFSFENPDNSFYNLEIDEYLLDLSCKKKFSNFLLNYTFL